MENKPILKNTSKYHILKMASGVDLGLFMDDPDNYMRYNRDRYSNGWIKKNGEYVFFKSKEFVDFQYVTKNRYVNELVADVVAKQIGIRTANYEPAHMNNINGIISYDVTKPYEDLFTLSDLVNLSSYDTSLDAVNSKWDDSYIVSYEADKKQIMFELYKMIVFDTLTMQEDRHANNIFFIRDSYDNTIRLSPLIDNEFSFALKTVDDFIKNKAYRLDDGYDKEKFLRIHSTNLRFTISPQYALKNYERYQQNVTDLINMALKNPQYKEFLVNSLKSINIEKAICAVEKKGYEISPDYRQYLIDVVDLAKQVFAQKIAEIKQTNPKVFEDNVEYGKF